MMVVVATMTFKSSRPVFAERRCRRAPVRDGDSEAGASVRDGDSSDGTACCGGGDAWAHALFEPAPVRAR